MMLYLGMDLLSSNVLGSLNPETDLSVWEILFN